MSDDAIQRDHTAASDETQAEVERWREGPYRRAVERAGEREPRFTTSSEIETQQLYTEADLAEWRPADALGFPGEYPFTRGIQPTMYRGRPRLSRYVASSGTPM